MQVNAYLNFDGTTEEAFNFYKSVFGGEFTQISRFKEVPGNPFPSEEQERIMHIALPVGTNALMGTDVSKASGHALVVGNNINVSLHPEKKEEAQRIFDGLSAGGTVEMPLQKMFWGDYFAAFTDKFGVRWMINCADKS